MLTIPLRMVRVQDLQDGGWHAVWVWRMYGQESTGSNQWRTKVDRDILSYNIYIKACTKLDKAKDDFINPLRLLFEEDKNLYIAIMYWI